MVTIYPDYISMILPFQWSLLVLSPILYHIPHHYWLYICIPWYVSEKIIIHPQIVTNLPHRWWETIGFGDLPYFQIRGQVDGNSWLQSRCFLVAYWNTGTPKYHRLGDISYISHKITTVAAKTTTGWWFQPFWKILASWDFSSQYGKITNVPNHQPDN